jgi:hypothetical protein
MRRSNAPYWIIARYGGRCSNPQCQRGVKKGEEILYYPATKTFLCCYEPCGRKAQTDMDAERFDEAVYAGHW